MWQVDHLALCNRLGFVRLEELEIYPLKGRRGGAVGVPFGKLVETLSFLLWKFVPFIRRRFLIALLLQSFGHYLVILLPYSNTGRQQADPRPC